MSEKHPIRLCPKCKKPIVPTFCMAYKEYGCIECNLWWEFFNDLGRVEEPNKEQWKEFKRRKKDWEDDKTYIGIRYGGMICSNSRNRVLSCDCKKCIKIKKIKPKFWKQND